MFDVATSFDNVRITLYFSAFELCIEITLQLRFASARPFDIFFIASQLRSCLLVVVTYFDGVGITLVRSNYVLKLRYKMVSS